MLKRDLGTFVCRPLQRVVDVIGDDTSVVFACDFNELLTAPETHAS